VEATLEVVPEFLCGLGKKEFNINMAASHMGGFLG
jgi:hypothetical protein